MPDVFTKAKRSEVMSRIRSRGNRDTELALAKLFRAHRITGWRRQRILNFRSSQRQLAHASVRAVQARDGVRADSRRLLQVQVDFVFPKLELAIFVDGCFWHGCPKHATWPANRAAWWRKKILGNQARDALVTRTLRRAGWRVLRVWEHELAKKTERKLIIRIQRVFDTSPRPFP
ncbi:MAG: very short patch repair endonuclease [Verrucomicrobiae bacterium]|nr:very short patch repair endonuclease [Verrucomicrobiae bacterium]